MMKFACFERTVEALYKFVVPKPRAQCSKGEQLIVTFVAGYIGNSLFDIIYLFIYSFYLFIYLNYRIDVVSLRGVGGVEHTHPSGGWVGGVSKRMLLYNSFFSR